MNYGVLQSRMPYLVYGIILYCDDFNPFSNMFPQGSAGGVRLLLVGIPPKVRRSSSFIRILSLTPPNVSSKFQAVIAFILDDLIYGTVNGIYGVLPDGKPCKIFLDIVGFIGDYPATANTLYVLGHNASYPCTLCSFRRLAKNSATESINGYNTSIFAKNYVFLRNAARNELAQQSSIHPHD